MVSLVLVSYHLDLLTDFFNLSRVYLWNCESCLSFDNLFILFAFILSNELVDVDILASFVSN